jgi:hypothetical protein
LISGSMTEDSINKHVTIIRHLKYSAYLLKLNMKQKDSK